MNVKLVVLTIPLSQVINQRKKYGRGGGGCGSGGGAVNSGNYGTSKRSLGTRLVWHMRINVLGTCTCTNVCLHACMYM